MKEGRKKRGSQWSGGHYCSKQKEKYKVWPTKHYMKKNDYERERVKTRL